MHEMNLVDPVWAWQPFEATADRPWDRSLAAHLYRRAGFGADLETLDAAVSSGPLETVERLFSQSPASAEFQQTADSLAFTVLASGNPKQLSAAWVYRMLLTPDQLLEKATLFWHGHFATSAEKVNDAHMMWDQNQLIRTHALGDFGELAQKIAQDPAMLVYLDSAMNRKAHPNENFARELMELFCLGEGHYTERDVQELARCFTGWEIRNKKFRKNRYQHDAGTKSILGQDGDFDGEDAVRVVTQQPQMELFLAAKWFRYFICDEPQPSAALLQPLADALRHHNLQVAPALKMLFISNLFYSRFSVGRKIKSPVELVIGMLRSLKGTTNAPLVADGLRQVGHGLFYPPSVKGWDGGRAWINSSTLLGRANVISKLLEADATRFDGKRLPQYLQDLDVRSTDAAIEHFEQCLFAVEISKPHKARLVELFDLRRSDHPQPLTALLHAVTTMPECQLG
ncbi:MAG: DUF1800 domain-containing protein [Planctomycetaceae bacterium]